MTIDNKDIEFAFELIEQAIKDGHRFTNRQKDLCIQATLDALAPTERPWFFEVANTLRIPLWQTLWGQWRRNQENGMAQAPILDPGWESDRFGNYGLEEKLCPSCGNIFKPKNVGQLYCSNRCGAEAERVARRRNARHPMVTFTPGPIVPEDSVDLGTDIVPDPHDHRVSSLIVTDDDDLGVKRHTR